MSGTIKRPKWSRRRWIAEHLNCDMAEVETYQDTRQEYPLFQYEGRIATVVLTKADVARFQKLDAWEFAEFAHWKDPSVRIFLEKA